MGESTSNVNGMDTEAGRRHEYELVQLRIPQRGNLATGVKKSIDHRWH